MFENKLDPNEFFIERASWCGPISDNAPSNDSYVKEFTHNTPTSCNVVKRWCINLDNVESLNYLIEEVGDVIVSSKLIRIYDDYIE